MIVHFFHMNFYYAYPIIFAHISKITSLIILFDRNNGNIIKAQIFLQKAALPKICHTYSIMIKLVTVIF